MFQHDPLTRRELDILKLLCKRLSNQEIADELVISIHTVKSYNRQIYQKLGVRNRNEAIALTETQQLIQTETDEQLSDNPPPQTHLPGVTTSLIGREKAVNDVLKIFDPPDHRLLTILGPGGIGKTRLAIEVGTQVADKLEMSVFFVELAPIKNPELLYTAILDALRNAKQLQNTSIDDLRGYLRDKQFVLILDNFEHLISAAFRVADLLKSAPHIKVLVTSREPLQIYGEIEYALSPLDVPETDSQLSKGDIVRYDAIQLFVQRAQAHRHDFQLTDDNVERIATICHQLEGLPLAIELVAGRIKYSTLPVLIDQLQEKLDIRAQGWRDKPRRLQTLRGAIEWSYDLLNPTEKILFRRLSIFVGGWTAEAAQSLLYENPVMDIQSHLESLLNKSMIQPEPESSNIPRLRMLETIREYAADRLLASDETSDIRRQHALYFLELSRQADQAWGSSEQLIWLERVRTEFANIHSAWVWAKEQREAEILVQITNSMALYLLHNTNFEQRARWFEEALEFKDEIAPQLYADLLQWTVQSRAADHKSVVMLQEALDIFREHGPPLKEAYTLLALAHSLQAFDKLTEAQACVQEAYILFTDLQDRRGISGALLNFMDIALYSNDFERAESYGQQVLALNQTPSLSQLDALSLLGYLALRKQDYETASSYFLKVTELLLGEIKTSRNINDCLIGIADILQNDGDIHYAVQLLSAAQLAEENNTEKFWLGSEEEVKARIKANIRAQTNPESFDLYWKQGYNMRPEHALALARKWLLARTNNAEQ